MRAKINWRCILATHAPALVFIAAAIPGTSAPYQSDANQRLCSIKGTVTDAVADNPLRKAFVRLRASATEITYPAVTDDTGTFVIESVMPGSYTLETEHQGFIESQYGDAKGRVIQLRLTPGESLTAINIKLTPQAVISGRVVDDDGEVWTHVQVGLNRVVSERGRRRLQGYSGGEVDDQGQFRIGQLPPGKYYLSAEPNLGWENRNHPTANRLASLRQPTWYPSARDLDGSTPIILEPGQQLSGLEIRLLRGTVYRILGRVSGIGDLPAFPDRGPFATRTISADLVSGVAANGYHGVLRPDGSFEIQGVPSGSYEIHVHQGLPPINLGRVAVQVDDRDVEDVAINLVAPRRLNGRIQIEGNKSVKPSGLSVGLLPLESGTWSQSAVSRDDGSFDFALVGSERYRVRIQGEVANAFYIKGIRYGDTESSDGTVSISGVEGSLVLILSTNGARLVAKVRGAREENQTPSSRGSGPLTPQVVLIPEKPQGDTRVGLFDQNGSFSFDNLAPGAYKLYAFQEVPEGSWEDPDFVKEIKNGGVDIQLSEGDVQSTEVPLLLKADLGPTLKKLGLE
jgi:hypothetical protein